MRTLLAVLFAVSFTTAAYAAEPAKAEPAKAAPAKAEPAKAEPAKAEPAKAEPAKAEPAKAEPKADDCDACKANMAMMKAGKVAAHKLDNGNVVMITAQGKKLEELKKAAGEMATTMKAAMEGKAKLDENCAKMVEAMKAGKVMMGHGEMKDGFVSATLSSDPEIVKNMHAMMDKMAAPPAKAAPAKK